MNKILVALSLSATLTTSVTAPAFANTEVNSRFVQQSAPNLVELDGRILTDAEAADVEGEFKFLVVPAVGAVGGMGYNAWRNVKNGRSWHNEWHTSAAAGAIMSTCGTAGIATRGMSNLGPCGVSNVGASQYLRSRW